MGRCVINPQTEFAQSTRNENLHDIADRASSIDHLKDERRQHSESGAQLNAIDSRKQSAYTKLNEMLAANDSFNSKVGEFVYMYDSYVEYLLGLDEDVLNGFVKAVVDGTETNQRIIDAVYFVCAWKSIISKYNKIDYTSYASASDSLRRILDRYPKMQTLMLCFYKVDDAHVSDTATEESAKSVAVTNEDRIFVANTQKFLDSTLMMTIGLGDATDMLRDLLMHCLEGKLNHHTKYMSCLSKLLKCCTYCTSQNDYDYSTAQSMMLSCFVQDQDPLAPCLFELCNSIIIGNQAGSECAINDILDDSPIVVGQTLEYLKNDQTPHNKKVVLHIDDCRNNYLKACFLSAYGNDAKKKHIYKIVKIVFEKICQDRLGDARKYGEALARTESREHKYLEEWYRCVLQVDYDGDSLSLEARALFSTCLP